MAERKRDEVGQAAEQLEEVRPTPDTQMAQGISPIELMMAQVVEELESLPTAAQLVVLRSFVPQLLGALDAFDRAYWARELVGEGVPEIATPTV